MWSPKRTTLRAFLITSYLQVLQCQQFPGDSCHHKVKGASGVCTVIKDCQSAMLGLRKGIDPQKCGFEGILPVVCCVEDSTPTIPPPKAAMRSLQKCEEYKQYTFVEEVSPLLSVNPQRRPVSECPHYKTTGLVSNYAMKNEFPHMALIGFDQGHKKVWICEGSLISENYVLTAAHCLDSQSYGPPTVVRLGDRNLNELSDDEDVQELRIKKLIPHPGYVYPSRYNDIALLLLETRPKLGLAARPACLFTERRSTWRAALVTGWGSEEDGVDKNGWLMRIVAKFYTAEMCNDSFVGDKGSLKNGIDDEMQVCAGSDYKEKNTFQGYSGGPLQLYSAVHCMYDIVAVTSFRQINETVRGVYTRVYPYLKWIEDEVWP